MRDKYLPIGGFLKQSLIDYPGNISTVIFIKGCNFRCFYCHNPELVLPHLIKQHPDIDIMHILQWIKENLLLLDAVVVTGGEPTLYPDLIKLLEIIKNIPLKIKLDTNGTNPKILTKIIENNLVDYIAMDIKSSLIFDKYKKIAGEYFTEETFENIKHSIDIIINGQIDYEFRTTLNHLLDESDLINIINQIKGKFFIQKLNLNTKLVDTAKCYQPNIDLSRIIDYAKTKNNVIVNIRD